MSEQRPTRTERIGDPGTGETPAEAKTTRRQRRKARRAAKKAAGTRIRDWKGLIHDESPRMKMAFFGMLFAIACSMTFTMLGFIGVGSPGNYSTYAFGLLVPLTVCALLLGGRTAALMGGLSGAVMLLHAHLQPLDLYERYFMNLVNSVVLYALAGLLLGWLFAVALHKNPQGKRRIVYLLLVSLAASAIVSVVFLCNALLNVLYATVSAYETSGVVAVPPSYLQAIISLGGIDIQILLDTVLVFVTSLLTIRLVYRYNFVRNYISVRTTFRIRMFATILVVLFAAQAISFCNITVQNENAAAAVMQDDLEFVGSQLVANQKSAELLANDPAFDQLAEETVHAVYDSNPSLRLIDGYSLDDGTVVAFLDDVVVFSNNPAYAPGTTKEDLFGQDSARYIEEIAQSGDVHTMVYKTEPQGGAGVEDSAGEETGELGYMCLMQADDFLVLRAMPGTQVFAGRSSTQKWSLFIASAVVIAVYVSVAYLLNKNMVTPIDRTNASLSRIMKGDLDVIVSEVGNVEFASLSAGINATVGSLKDLIAETERRMERDLATAKRIQESALPRTFPPFPEIEAFDLYASMNAAKEVGGDFYDFFLIDDHTLGFLIADVSGKGIPGALFMMAAKTEIENYLSTGMDPAAAIASANRRLCKSNEAGMFVTVWAATLDWRTGLLTYVNAGHNFPLLRRGDGGEWEWLKEKCGLFLGTFETAKYRQKTLALEPGDELLLYTDGVNEAFNVDEEEYGNDRLEAFLADHRDLDPQDLTVALRGDVARWAEGAEQSDDITILALEFGATPDASAELVLPAVVESLNEAMDFVAKELERRLCPVGALHQVEVALEELFVNVCRYAYADCEEPGEVRISYTYHGKDRSLTVTLRDTGAPFDPVAYGDPTPPSSIEDAQIGGLGIFMVKRSMDDFTYERDGDANVVTFTKGW